MRWLKKLLGTDTYDDDAFTPDAAGPPHPMDPTTPAAPSNEPPGRIFGKRTAWLAIRSDSATDVAAALGLDASSTTWSEGLETWQRDRDSVFVTPPVRGWVLVFTHALAPPTSAYPDAHSALLVDLSATFGEAQSFFAHDGDMASGWGRAVDGEVQRVFFCLHALTLQQVGLPGPAEDRMTIEYPPSAADKDKTFDSSNGPCDKTVFDLAFRWSIDPNGLSRLDDFPRTNGLTAPWP